jgi:hypothetical protein
MREQLPDWPRLLSEPLAARYLSIGCTFLRERGPKPRKLGRRTLYDRRDLDLWADVLSGQPLDELNRRQASKEVERRFFEEQEAKAAKRR